MVISRRKFVRAGAIAGGALMLGSALTACGDSDANHISFLNWQDYIDPSILEDFRKRNGISVTYETYASNDELARRLSLADTARRRGRRGSSFDLIVPSDYFLVRLKELEAIQELDRDTVTQLDNLAPAFRRQPFDPGNRFSIPWATGTTGIGYDSTVFDQPPEWEVFLDDTYQGQMTLLNERRDAFGVALFALGEDPNTRDQVIIDRAADLLIEMKPIIQGFDSAGYLDKLTEGEVVCAHAYSSDVLQARERNPDLEFTIPPQGSFRWIDSMCIPEGSPNPEAANQFINFFLEPEISATNAVASKVDTGNQAAREFIPQDILDDNVIFPSPETLDRLVFAQDLGEDEELYDQAWARVLEA